MPRDIDVLTDKEKETLRFLLGGHDAKSIARELDLSVHTINDRLREARRKLGVTSSREAARVLAQGEGIDPNIYAHKKFGVGETKSEVHATEESERNQGSGTILVLLGGGALMISLVVATVFFLPLGGDRMQVSSDSADLVEATAANTSHAASIGAAKDWLVLVDAQNWGDSWRSAGSIFRSQVSRKSWAATILPVRQPLGALTSRSFLKVTKTTSLPGAPVGEYELIEFQSDFANKRGAIETLVLANEGAAWKVVGYFIR